MFDFDPSAINACSYNVAGPPVAKRRVCISVISKTVETGSRTRTSFCSLSNRAMNSRMLL